MIITNAIKEEDNTWTFDLKLTNEEVEILVDYGVQTMLRQGLLILQEQDEEQNIPLPGSNFTSTGTIN